MTAVGFEPTPLRTGAWSQRLRPLGQTVHASNKSLVFIKFKISVRFEILQGLLGEDELRVMLRKIRAPGYPHVTSNTIFHKQKGTPGFEPGTC